MWNATASVWACASPAVRENAQKCGRQKRARSHRNAIIRCASMKVRGLGELARARQDRSDGDRTTEAAEYG
eukprot:229572-Pleurochrysis_carterae.AAC.1